MSGSHPPSSPDLAVVIPACNEAAVIGRTVAALGRQTSRPARVVVACNGCTDDTAAVARRAAADAGFDAATFAVVEADEASKTAALNAGDATIDEGRAVVYLDADVTLCEDALSAMADCLAGGALATAPPMRVSLDGASWPVRAFYRVWLSLPYHRDGGMIGSGVYALSPAGRGRVMPLPRVIADDAVARAAFAPGERRTCDRGSFEIRVPRDVRSLVRVKTRSRLGNYELARVAEVGRRAGGGGTRSAWLRRAAGLAVAPARWADLPVYFGINLVARARARGQLRRRDLRWERDDSTRVAAA